jgi:thioredoxin-related protein
MEIFDDSEMISPPGDSLRVKQFAKKEGVEYSPTLLFYGEKSEPLLKIVGYQSPERFKTILDYLTGQHFRSESFRDYSNRLATETSASHPDVELEKDRLFMKPPYALDRSRFPADKPLLVIFEKSACKECEEFHDEVLSLNEIRAELEKFEIARFDANDGKTPVLTPDGKRVTPAIWFDQTAFTRVPGLLFFDENGNEVLKTDALVLHQRMMNSLGFVLERAYKKGWTYQRFARSKSIERQQKR